RVSIRGCAATQPAGRAGCVATQPARCVGVPLLVSRGGRVRCCSTCGGPVHRYSGAGACGFRYAAAPLLNPRGGRLCCRSSRGRVAVLSLVSADGGCGAARPAPRGRPTCGCAARQSASEVGWITVESRGPTAAMFHVKHREGFVTTPSPFDASTPLAREVADITRLRLALAAETFSLPDQARLFTVANQ